MPMKKRFCFYLLLELVLIGFSLGETHLDHPHGSQQPIYLKSAKKTFNEGHNQKEHICLSDFVTEGPVFQFDLSSDSPYHTELIKPLNKFITYPTEILSDILQIENSKSVSLDNEVYFLRGSNVWTFAFDNLQSEVNLETLESFHLVNETIIDEDCYDIQPIDLIWERRHQFRIRQVSLTAKAEDVFIKPQEYYKTIEEAFPKEKSHFVVFCKNKNNLAHYAVEYINGTRNTTIELSPNTTKTFVYRDRMLYELQNYTSTDSTFLTIYNLLTTKPMIFTKKYSDIISNSVLSSGKSLISDVVLIEEFDRADLFAITQDGVIIYCHLWKFTLSYCCAKDLKNTTIYTNDIDFEMPIWNKILLTSDHPRKLIISADNFYTYQFTIDYQWREEGLDLVIDHAYAYYNGFSKETTLHFGENYQQKEEALVQAGTYPIINDTIVNGTLYPSGTLFCYYMLYSIDKECPARKFQSTNSKYPIYDVVQAQMDLEPCSTNKHIIDTIIYHNQIIKFNDKEIQAFNVKPGYHLSLNLESLKEKGPNSVIIDYKVFAQNQVSEVTDTWSFKAKSLGPSDHTNWFKTGLSSFYTRYFSSETDEWILVLCFVFFVLIALLTILWKIIGKKNTKKD